MSDLHSKRCRLTNGNTWRECACAEIDPSDRPCVVCDEIAVSAKGCDVCAVLGGVRARLRAAIESEEATRA